MRKKNGFLTTGLRLNFVPAPPVQPSTLFRLFMIHNNEHCFTPVLSSHLDEMLNRWSHQRASNHSFHLTYTWGEWKKLGRRRNRLTKLFSVAEITPETIAIWLTWYSFTGCLNSFVCLTLTLTTPRCDPVELGKANGWGLPKPNLIVSFVLVVSSFLISNQGNNSQWGRDHKEKNRISPKPGPLFPPCFGKTCSGATRQHHRQIFPITIAHNLYVR